MLNFLTKSSKSASKHVRHVSDMLRHVPLCSEMITDTSSVLLSDRNTGIGLSSNSAVTPALFMLYRIARSTQIATAISPLTPTTVRGRSFSEYLEIAGTPKCVSRTCQHPLRRTSELLRRISEVLRNSSETVQQSDKPVKYILQKIV